MNGDIRLRAESLHAPRICRGLQQDLTVCSTEVVAITGASGIGKSSLLQLLCGVQMGAGGRVGWGKQVVSLENDACFFQRQMRAMLQKEEVAYQSQHPISLSGWSPRWQLKLVRCFSSRRRRGRISQREVVELLELDEVMVARSCAELSGGELARLMLARTLLSQPRSLVLDEPFSALQQRLAEKILSGLRTYVAHTSGLLLYTTHRTDLLGFADRVVSLSAESSGPSSGK